VKARPQSEHITSVLYPNDKTLKGKELRLKQQYFFCSASLRDIIRRMKKINRSLKALPSLVAIQLNDTHPIIAIPELMRILMDEEGLGWAAAWDIVTATFAYTNHTVLPEALEKWSVDLIGNLLPRHLQIIFEVNRRFLNDVAEQFPGDFARLSAMSLIEEGNPKMVRMAHLAIVGSHSINGVAQLHSEILKDSVFRQFYELWPNKFNNKTNGVTPRRWILDSNPAMSQLITDTLGNQDWVKDLSLVSGIKKYADDAEFQNKFSDAKKANKERLRQLILKITNGELDVNTSALFDVQIKRIHEYKRQLLNILGVIARYNRLKEMKPEQRKGIVPRVCIFAGKAAPGYYAAKVIIKLINAVAEVVNHDRTINDLIKVIFIPNYNVSLAEVIIPANDISEHISTAGTEASGTSNMKFAMNGGLIIGTLDGANVEICEEAGIENEFIFGARSNEVASIRAAGPQPIDERLYHALQTIQQGTFGTPDLFKSILEPIWKGNDYYLIAHDFSSYLKTQDEVDECYKRPKEWLRRCILTTGSMGKFSSDNTIRNYANEIWDIEPCRLPDNVDEIFHQ
jgi:starch phosphorylase